MIKKIAKQIFDIYQNYNERKRYGSFLQKNGKAWKEYLKGHSYKKNAIILTECNTLTWTYGHMALAQITAKTLNAQVAYFGNNNANRILRESLGPCFHFDLDIIKEKYENEIHKETNIIYNKLKSPGEILEIKFNNLLIGDLIYDAALRVGRWKATIHQIDDTVFNSIKTAVEYIFCLDSIYEKYDVKAVCSTHKTGFLGILFRYAVNKKTLGISGSIGSGAIRKHYHFNGRRLPYSQSINKSFLDSILNSSDLKENLILKSKNHLEKRLLGKLEKDTATKKASFGKKTYLNKLEFGKSYKLDTDKKIIFVMIHAFNDMPHHFDNSLYTDYYKWFIETLKIAKQVTNVNWVFKEHPNSNMYPDDSNLNGIFELCDSKNITFIGKDDNFSSNSIQHLADCIITCVGTAGLEYSCLGIPAIIASENAYSNHNLCYEPKTIEEYVTLLKNIPETIRPLSKSQIEKAKILFYIQHVHLFSVNVENDALMPKTSHQDKIIYSDKQFMDHINKEISKESTVNTFKNIEKFIIDKRQKTYYKSEFLRKIEIKTSNSE